MKTPALDHEPAAAPRRDLLLVCGGAALFWVLSAALELNERMLAWTRPWERYQLDELPGVLLFLALALAWYSWRRVQEARAQVQRRVVAEARLAETLLENRRLSLSHVRVQEDERKQLARELHDELGLSAALEHLVETWRARNTLTRAELTLNTDIDDLHEQENITLYRIMQESLNNVARHAQAANVKIRLDREARGIVLTVSDDGAGAKDWNAVTGLGLVGMRERVEALGGTLAITSNAGQGFLISAAIPAAKAAA